jgi:hypothetical protein
MRRPCGVTGALILALLLSACGRAASPTEPPPTPSPSPISSTVQWRIELINQGEVSFGVRMRLDGQEVYSDASLKEHHLVEVERPYLPGPHAIEFEILRATRRTSTYKAALTVQVIPTGPWVHADGVPTVLTVGGRLAISFTI